MKRICSVALAVLLLAALSACSTGLEDAVAERQGPSRPSSRVQSAAQASSGLEEPAQVVPSEPAVRSEPAESSEPVPPVAEESAGNTAEAPADEPVEEDTEDESDAAAAQDAGTAFANFYRSYIEAINEQDASLLDYCTEDCRAEMTTRIFDANNSTQTYEILEIAVDLESISGTSVYTRTTTNAFNRKTGAFLDKLETVRLVQLTRDADGNWLVDSVAVDYTYVLSDSLHLL